ncbi:hypothetical protein QMM53_17375 [Leptospira santarosai]|uniref:hypothetical protein n=1 Tax=Leptospira santarosai TaxID=28183 RepID=UPI0024AE9F36|nr:hypothetical protein [Leptospira santarosai]MDI7158278.1 hypothetical protein [Leptospira santarosai]
MTMDKTSELFQIFREHCEKNYGNRMSMFNNLYHLEQILRMSENDIDYVKLKINAYMKDSFWKEKPLNPNMLIKAWDYLVVKIEQKSSETNKVDQEEFWIHYCKTKIQRKGFIRPFQDLPNDIKTEKIKNFYLEYNLPIEKIEH